MIDAFAIVDRLSTYTLGGLVTIILIGNYFKIWCFYGVVIDLKAECARRELEWEKRLAKEEVAKTRWESMALGTVGLVEHTVATKRNGL